MSKSDIQKEIKKLVQAKIEVGERANQLLVEVNNAVQVAVEKDEHLAIKMLDPYLNTKSK